MSSLQLKAHKISRSMYTGLEHYVPLCKSLADQNDQVHIVDLSIGPLDMLQRLGSGY